MGLLSALPFNQRIVTDANFVVTGQYPNPTPSLNFNVANPYPSTTEKIVLNVASVFNSATASGVTSSITLQQSADNVSWTNVSQKANPFIQIIQTSATPISSSVLTSFEPDGKQYFRASASLTPGSGSTSVNATGSITLTVGF